MDFMLTTCSRVRSRAASNAWSSLRIALRSSCQSRRMARVIVSIASSGRIVVGAGWRRGKVPIGAAGEKKRTKGAGAGEEKIGRPRAQGSRAVTHHEGLERGVELADPRPGTRGSGHDVLLRVAAVPDQLLELLDARLLDVRGLLQVLNLPIHGGAVGLGEARVLRLGDLLGGLGLLGVVGDGVGDRSVLDRVGLSLGIGGDGVHVDGGVVLGGGHLRE